MRVIKDNRRLSKSTLTALAGVGWIGILYLAWVVGQDSWERTMFSVAAVQGTLPEMDPFNQRYLENPRLTMLHTIPGLLFAILGPLQFMGPIRRRVPAVHRWSGRVFVLIGITSGVAAFLMTLRFPIWGMTLNTAISLVSSVFMVFAFVQALVHVRARRFGLHREWMIRGFATGMAVALFRVMLNDILPAMGVEDFTTRWNIVVTISFPILLGFAEFWIRATRPGEKRAAPADQPEPAPV